MYHTETITLHTTGRGTFEITSRVQEVVRSSSVRRGICTIFVHHTSASLIICENAEPEVRSDLERFFLRLIPDGDPAFLHTDEGPDDMPAHVRSILTQTSISVPVLDGRCDFGTWQGLYLWEHRKSPHLRRLTISVIGEAK